jgi:hypothetical protein
VKVVPQAVWDRYIRFLCPRNPWYARGQHVFVYGCRGIYQCIRQTHPVFLAQSYGFLVNAVIEGEKPEGAEKGARGPLFLLWCSDHDLHPGERANGSTPVLFQCCFCLRYFIQVVDQDVRIKKHFGPVYHFH